ncbi:MAG: hypothetical protein HY801_03030, partial [Candidatus Lindowbacteria bacterium]|nr:hypothetical protein [Candidatus Lindowbacteria bacterium]
HHIVGYFVAPVILIHALVEGSLRKNLRGLLGILGVVVALFVAYAVQTAMLHQNPVAVTGKAFSESILDLSYLRGFFSVEWRKLPPNYYELLTVPLVALAVYWTVATTFSGKGRTTGDWLILLWLLLPLAFFIVFLGMVASHLNFLTLFAPFLVLSASRALSGRRASGGERMRLRAFLAAAVIGYTAFICYKTQRKYDMMIWSPDNQRGYELARGLKELVREDEAVAGVNPFGYSFNSLSPAFSFYLQRDYFGNISSVGQLSELMNRKKVSHFLFPAPALKSRNPHEQALGAYLIRNYPFHVDPARRDLMIFDLRTPHGPVSQSQS